MEEVKPTTVKYIVTRYVEADAAQFKSVVQSLTGKDSTAVDEARRPPASRQKATGSRCQSQTGDVDLVPAPAGGLWQRRNNGGFLNAMPSVEEMDEFFRD
ncbi:hypothetical protein GUJ93_ZPchr0005g16132 [Zizania palustris]|uniref:VQ domain-containing protein n=1 Tax=Zizania palustris TaxID=103762 RepID=A0A8J5SRI1_ZIZPA|nr:hypothetical protein GUJ93_ZPchr0005g16132 [Zizania palustris]